MRPDFLRCACFLSASNTVEMTDKCQDLANLYILGGPGLLASIYTFYNHHIADHGSDDKIMMENSSDAVHMY